MKLLFLCIPLISYLNSLAQAVKVVMNMTCVQKTKCDKRLSCKKPCPVVTSKEGVEEHRDSDRISF